MVNDTKYAQLMRYIEASWPLVPLHDVSGGHCSCREGAACRYAGKHPRLSGWEREEHLVRTAADLTAWHERTAGACERWNWGLATGASSGIWVADFDPASAGDDAKLMWERLVSGVPAETGGTQRWARQHTGGGGAHLFFALPPDFEPYNTQGKSRSGMPIGLDVRSHHGQVVLDPSVSGKGVYTLAERYVPKAAELARAPGWFEELHRVAWRERAAGASKAQLSADATVYSGPSSTPGAGAARGAVHPYASAAVAREIASLRDAPIGTRDDVAFASAAALWELINSPWSGLDEHAVWLAWTEASCAMGAPEAVHAGAWGRARARVAGNSRPEPSDVRAGVLDAGGGGMFAQPGGVVAPVAVPVVPEASTWRPVDLSDVLSGQRRRVTPELGRRHDGVRLMYRGKEHSIASEPECGKTWWAALQVADVLAAGGKVVFVDFEDDEYTIVGERLIPLGVPRERLTEATGQFRYVRPEAPYRIPEWEELMCFAGGAPADLVVLDGVTEGMQLFGLDPLKQPDAAQWRRIMIRPALNLGAATLATDHVVKDRDSRQRFAIGAQHKLAGLTGVQFLMEQVDPFGKGLKGRSRVLISKDRNGGLRQFGKSTDVTGVSHIGDLVGDASDGEMKTLHFYEPMTDETREAIVDQNITRLARMALIEIGKSNRPLGVRDIKSRVTGRSADVGTALAWLEDNEHAYLSIVGSSKLYSYASWPNGWIKPDDLTV